MSDIAIRVGNLGKMYRIGTAAQKPQNRWQAAKQTALSPFDYMRQMRRPPTAEETLWALRDVSFEVKRGEAVAAHGQTAAAAALWQTINNAQGQLDARIFWYQHIDDAQRLEWVQTGKQQAFP